MSFTGILKKASNLILRSQSDTQPSTFNTEGEVIFCKFEFFCLLFMFKKKKIMWAQAEPRPFVYIFKLTFTIVKYLAHQNVLLGGNVMSTY